MFPNLKTWFLANVDTGQILKGQFEPEGTTKNIAVNYAQHTALNRQNPILQFLNRAAETISFRARLFNRHALEFQAEDTLKLLESWTEIDPKYNRPPTMSFWVGDGHLQQIDCVITSLDGITYGRPTFFGGLREVSLTINLLQYEPFSLESTGIFETRYHRSRVRDYYELISEREYKQPLLGDVIRKRHPTQPVLQVGDVIKMPSIEAIRSERVEPKSIPLTTAYGKKLTAQKERRLEMFDARNRTYVSHVVIA